MKKCKSCGFELHEEINICPQCGTPVDDKFSANQSSIERMLRDSIVKDQIEHDKKYFEKNTSKRFNIIFSLAIVGVVLFVAIHFLPTQRYSVMRIPGLLDYDVKGLVSLLSVSMSAIGMISFYVWSRQAMARTHTPMRMMLTANLHTCVCYATLSALMSIFGAYVSENTDPATLSIQKVLVTINFIVLVQYEVYALLLGKMLSYNFEGDFKYVGKILMLVAISRLIYISLFLIYSPEDLWTKLFLIIAATLTIYLYILIKRILR